MKLPIVSADQIMRALSSIDFAISRQSGSHIIMTRIMENEKTTVVIPKHREIARGTLLSIIAQSGMTKEEFIRLLR
jgi:predicted RNA binding protein YcfA (HicA-like mRNA interferase family)